MRYALLICTDQSVVISAEERSRRITGLMSVQEQLRVRGVLVGSELLQPADAAVTVRAWDGGDIEIANGPAARPKEQITGVFTVDCGNLDEAIEVATKIPAAWYGTIEIRPICDRQLDT
jgi:hypothetical protein